MSTSGFYTNRVSASHIIALLQRANVEVEVVSRSLWPEPRIGRGQIARGLSECWTDEDLRVCSMNLIARPAISDYAVGRDVGAKPCRVRSGSPYRSNRNQNRTFPDLERTHRGRSDR